MADPVLKSAIRSEAVVLAPGGVDPMTARIAGAVAFPALSGTGHAAVASSLWRPDAGNAPCLPGVDTAAQIPAVTAPTEIADAGAGHRGLRHARRAAAGSEAAGIRAIRSGDRNIPTWHVPGRKVGPPDGMLRVLDAAVDSRPCGTFPVIARAHVRTAPHRNEAIRHGKAIRDPGPGAVPVAAREPVAGLPRVRDAGGGPVQASPVTSGSTPPRTAQDLAVPGDRVGIRPVARQPAWADRPVRSNARDTRPPVVSGGLTRLTGIAAIPALEAKHAS